MYLSNNSYLNNRVLRTKINYAFSSYINASPCVPRGFVIGPL